MFDEGPCSCREERVTVEEREGEDERERERVSDFLLERYLG